MIQKWRLFQYVSPNGRKAIDDWRKALPIGPPRAYLDIFLRDMSKKEIWEPPDFEPLHGPQRGLMELRWKCGKLPHRLVGYVLADHQYVMLIGCTHRESYDPHDALETAVSRHKQIQEREARYAEYQLVLGS
jgi:hypothetical protein